MRRRPVVFALLFGCGSWISSCQLSEVSDTATTNASAPCGECASSPDGAASDFEVSPYAPTQETDEPTLGLCGRGSCIPDDRLACGGFVPPGSESGSSAGDAGSPDAGAPFDAGTPSSDAGSPRPAVDATFELSPQADSPQSYGCQVLLGPGTEMSRQCAVSGEQGVNEACSSGSDCAPGLACVGRMATGRCLPYCCSLGAQCDERSYCTHRPLRTESLEERLGPQIPVCDQVDDCDLADPFPCPPGQQCTCGEGEACTVVLPDGTTACERPGQGGESDPCPCRAGFICSQSTTTCHRLCRLDDARETCGGGVCQSSGGLPAGWGTCAGSSPEESR